MLAVSKDFAPPLKLVAPFFQVGVIFYLIAMLALMGFSSDFSYQELGIAGWMHLFLLGFVMMIIFGAMAQLIPVVLEVGHSVVDLFYVILPLLGFGTLIMVGGFWIEPVILPYGGMLVLTSMIIFAGEVFATLKDTKLEGITVKTIAISNIYLLIGILSGFSIALGLSGTISIDVDNILKAHIYTVIIGFVLLTVIGLSMTLLPMFSLAHSYDKKPVERAFNIISISVAIVFIASLIGITFLQWIGYILAITGISFYIYQIYLIFQKVVRKEMDIWAKSMIFGFSSLLLSLVLGTIYLFGADITFLHSSVWFFSVGFIGFLINGHLYKIVPFLVWFERYAPLVGKEKVPMFHEMYSKLQAQMMFWYSFFGTIFCGFGLLIKNDFLFNSGAYLLIVGALFLYLSLKKMLKFGENKIV